MAAAMRAALKELRLDGGRVAWDDLGIGHRLGVKRMQPVDGYDALMFARAVKTDTEPMLLERSTRLNEMAIHLPLRTCSLHSGILRQCVL